jgi:hypothetical protein
MPGTPGDRSRAEASVASRSKAQGPRSAVPRTAGNEVVAHPKSRRFTSEYKLRIVREAERCRGAKALVDSLVTDAGRIGEVLKTATAADRRDLPRAIVHEVVLDTDKGEGEIAFHAIPRLVGEKRTDGASGNDERTRPFEGMSSHMQMAGARLVGGKRTCRVRIIRKPWLFRTLRRAAG